MCLFRSTNDSLAVFNQFINIFAVKNLHEMLGYLGCYYEIFSFKQLGL